MKVSDYSIAEQTALRNIVCPDASDDHINYYLRVCKAQGVDPFSGLLYMTVRTNKGKLKPVVVASIDGARSKASRTEGYAGSDEPVYDSEEGEHPRWCRVTVYRMTRGTKCAFTAKIRWEEFKPAPPNDFQWKSKPYHMLAKCAEMSALRKAFPDVVPAGNEEEYTEETSEPEKKVEDAVASTSPLTAKWQNAVKAMAPYGITSEAMLAKVGKKAPKDIVAEDLEKLFVWYEELQRDAIPPPEML